MTVSLYEILKAGEYIFSKKDISAIGLLCIAKAKEVKIRYHKNIQHEIYNGKKEKHNVAFYPESFSPHIEEILKQYFINKCIQEIKEEPVPVATASQQIKPKRPRIKKVSG